MSPAVLLVLVAATSCRVWRLLAQDTISEPLRDRLHERVRDWLECPWCGGAWVAGLVVLAVVLINGLPLPLLWWATASLAVGIVGPRLG